MLLIRLLLPPPRNLPSQTVLIASEEVVQLPLSKLSPLWNLGLVCLLAWRHSADRPFRLPSRFLMASAPACPTTQSIA